jgi:ATP-dependent RNA helicase DeaD
VLEQLQVESGLPLIDIAAALAHLAQGSSPLLLGKPKEPEQAPVPARPFASPARPAASPARPAATTTARAPSAPRSSKAGSAAGVMETFRIEVGSVHGIKPGNVVGAIANEAGIEGVHIGRVDIREDHSYVDLPEGMPAEVFKDLQKVRVAGRELRISRVSEKPPKPARDTAGRHPGTRPAERKMLSRRRVKD